MMMPTPTSLVGFVISSTLFAACGVETTSSGASRPGPKLIAVEAAALDAEREGLRLVASPRPNLTSRQGERPAIQTSRLRAHADETRAALPPATDVTVLPIYGEGDACTVVEGRAPPNALVELFGDAACGGPRRGAATADAHGRFRANACFPATESWVYVQVSLGAAQSGCGPSQQVRFALPATETPPTVTSDYDRDNDCFDVDGSAPPYSVVQAFGGDACEGPALVLTTATAAGRFRFLWCWPPSNDGWLSFSTTLSSCADEVVHYDAAQGAVEACERGEAPADAHAEEIGGLSSSSPTFPPAVAPPTSNPSEPGNSTNSSEPGNPSNPSDPGDPGNPSDPTPPPDIEPPSSGSPSDPQAPGGDSSPGDSSDDDDDDDSSNSGSGSSGSDTGSSSGGYDSGSSGSDSGSSSSGDSGSSNTDSGSSSSSDWGSSSSDSGSSSSDSGSSSSSDSGWGSDLRRRPRPLVK